MSQPKRCWNDQHVDVIFYYLRKKSKNQIGNQYRYTTTNCLFKTYISDTHSRYYCEDANLSTQEDLERSVVVSGHERSITNIIKGYCIPAGLPWHQVDDVYVPLNCDGEYHWVLAVIVLKERLIRVSNSTPGRRETEPSIEIQKLTLMLPTYLENSDFYEHKDRVDWTLLDAYKDKSTGNLLGPQVPFRVEHVKGIAQQQSDSLDCGLFVATYAEYLSDSIPVPSSRIVAKYLRTRYAALLWMYGNEKANSGYVNEYDDPPRPKVDSLPPNEDELVVVE